MADLISFARGAPSVDLLPGEAVGLAAERAIAESPGRALSYGTGDGHPELREWLASRHGHGTSPDQLMITNGSLEAGWMLFQHLLRAGDTVFVEQPSYDRTLLMLERIGAERVGVALEENGIDVAALESLITGGEVPKVVHIISNFHNPAGCTLSEPKRRRLVELSEQHGFWLFEDDPYREVRFAGAEELPTMLSLAVGTGAKVIHASSFSKTVAPGVRVGYLVGPPEEIAALSKRASEIYISPNMLAESIVYHLCLSGGLDANIAVVNLALAARRDAVVEALGEQLPEARFVVPGGGYFLWLELESDVDTEALLPLAKEEGVAFVAGPDFMLEGGHQSLRLSFAGVRPEQAAEGIARIARALARQRG